MNEIIRQALDNCRSVYNLIHGPEAWLVVPIVYGVVGAAVIAVCIVNSSRLRDKEEEMRRNKHERKDDL